MIRFGLQTLVCLFLSVLAASAPPALKTGRLTIVLSGFSSDEGTARVALADSPEGFPRAEKAFLGARAAIENGVATVVLEAVPIGAYAVSAFHDENDNDRLDFRFFGAPKETYGFSNDARGRLGPPSFDAAKFQLAEGDNEIEITIR